VKLRSLKWPGLGAIAAGMLLAALYGHVRPAQAQEEQKPNINVMAALLNPLAARPGSVISAPRLRQREGLAHVVEAIDRCEAVL
jgi:hypothetical protein